MYQDVERLGQLAMSFRGARRDEERRAVADEYAKSVERLIQSGNWLEAPSFEDQLPDDWMPEAFYDYWAEQAGARGRLSDSSPGLAVEPVVRVAPPCWRGAGRRQ